MLVYSVLGVHFDVLGKVWSARSLHLVYILNIIFLKCVGSTYTFYLPYINIDSLYKVPFCD